ncbi:hypothetical protein C8J56DRAFT_800907 [Mycena floridula]|nr:hypothetical protein C8J56DRAFT_800907 [Mycena floridula]
MGFRGFLFGIQTEKRTHPFQRPKCERPETVEVEGFIKPSETAREARAQLAYYATKINSRQHRLHQFSLSISTDEVRFYRWNQAGVVVSRGFSYTTDSELLVDFLWRYANANDVQCGHDTTVSPATKEEKALAHQKLVPWAQKGIEHTVLKIRVFNSTTNTHVDVVTWLSLQERNSVVGRASRGYPCVELSTKKVTFLKDYWRDIATTPESQTIKTLDDVGVIRHPYKLHEIQDNIESFIYVELYHGSLTNSYFNYSPRSSTEIISRPAASPPVVASLKSHP